MSQTVKDYELFAACARCGRDTLFMAPTEADAIRIMRHSGWAFDPGPLSHHLCPDCLDDIVIAPSQGQSKANDPPGGPIVPD